MSGQADVAAFPNIWGGGGEERGTVGGGEIPNADGTEASASESPLPVDIDNYIITGFILQVKGLKIYNE